MQKKLSKAKQRLQEQFRQAAIDVITASGGVPCEGGLNDWTMQTRYGTLGLSVSKFPTEFGIGTVFTRFENAELATSHTGCNQYSGKWNFHYHEWDLERAINDFRQHLARVAMIPDEAARAAVDACRLAIYYADQAIIGGGPVRDNGDVMKAIRAAVANVDGVAA